MQLRIFLVCASFLCASSAWADGYLTAAAGGAGEWGRLPAYTGLVATRTLAPISINTTNKQLMSRSPHYMRDSVTQVKVLFPNWYVNPSSTHAELGSGADATITASIEYPAGVFTQILFGGLSSGTVPNGGNLVSDWVTVTIPDGALMWVRTFWTSTAGVLTIPHDLTGTGLPGAGLEVAVSGLTDKTMSGTVTAGDNEYSPVAIVATTTRPSVVIVGDSICLGDSSREVTGDASGDFGIVARSIGPNYAYASYCQNGDQAEDIVASHTNRAALFAYASHLISEYGSNDLYTNNASAATVLGLLQTIWGWMTDLGGHAYQTTITPRTTSTDNWATTGNQSHVSGVINTRRIDLNTQIRGMASGLSGYFDVADSAETARNSGLWRTTGAANGYVVDGIHPNTAGSVLVRDSRAINLRSPLQNRGRLTPAGGR